MFKTRPAVSDPRFETGFQKHYAVWAAISGILPILYLAEKSVVRIPGLDVALIGDDLLAYPPGPHSEWREGTKWFASA